MVFLLYLFRLIKNKINSFVENYTNEEIFDLVFCSEYSTTVCALSKKNRFYKSD